MSHVLINTGPCLFDFAKRMQRCSSSRMIPFLNALTSLRIIFRYLHRSLILQVSAATSYDMSSKLNKYCQIWGPWAGWILVAITCDAKTTRSRISIRPKPRASSCMWMRRRTMKSEIRCLLIFSRVRHDEGTACVLTPNNLTFSGARNREVCFNHMFCQCAKDKNEADFVVPGLAPMDPKGNENTFSTCPAPSFFRCFRETTVCRAGSTESRLKRQNSTGSHYFGQKRRRGAVTRYSRYFLPTPCSTLVTLLFLFCDLLAILSLLLNKGWRLLGVLPFCGDFPGCGAIPISRCNRHLANTQNLQQQHTHSFLSKNNTCSIWATLLAL